VRGAAVGIAAGRPAGNATVLLEAPRDAWRRVPRVKGFDLAYEMAHGESPFVDPSFAGLASDSPPLAIGTETFDRLLRRRDRRRRGPSRDLRVEHVLAALPAPPAVGNPVEGVRLDVFGVPSLRSVGGAPTWLVEVAATAGAVPPQRPPLDATIVLDRSTGGDPLGWTWLCRGLAAVGGQMRPRDHLSVVIAGPIPRVAIRRGTADEIEALAGELADLPATDSADIDAALRMAEQESSTRTGGLVIAAHEASVDRGRDDVRAALAKWHAFLAAAGDDETPGPDVPRFVVIEPVAAVDARGLEASFGRTTPDAIAIRRGLLRQVFGDDTLVARRCRLTVRFDPRQIAAYRLVGHRQSAMESLASAGPATLDLHAGDTTRAVYEVVPRGRPGASAVAAELEWRTGGGVAMTLRRGLAEEAPPSSVAVPSPHGCEVILAVALAETMADSAHADPRVAKEAARLFDRWRLRGDVTEFGERLAELGGRPAVERRPPR